MGRIAEGTGHARSLSTARAVLQVLAFLTDHPEGVRAGDVAKVVGKSTSTAYYLLSSLCEEGFAVHEARGGLYKPAGARTSGPEAAALADVATSFNGDLDHAVDELFARTRKRSYLGVVQAGGIVITGVRGRQGVPRMPGLGTRIREAAHATAMGKVVLAMLEPVAVQRYMDRGMPSFTPRTITEPATLAAELEAVRRDGFALDREEFDLEFCCVAAPVLRGSGRFAATVGVSMTTRGFDAEREEVIEAVCEVAQSLGAGLSGS
jgi:acetyl-CoA synthetase